MKKRVCMLVFNEVTSDPRVTKEAETLSDKYEVTVIGTRFSPSTASTEQVNGYSVHRVDNILKRKVNTEKLSILTLLRVGASKMVGLLKIGWVALKMKSDVYHAHDFEVLPFAYLASKIHGAYCVYDSHELWVEQRADFPGWFKKIIKGMESFFIRRVDQVITVNQSIARELMERYSLRTIPCVVHNFTKKIGNSIDMREASNISDTVKKKIVVLYHGGYLKDRGLEETIESVKYFPPHVILRFRGKGPLEEKLRSLAEPYIKSEQIEFCPPVPMKQLVKEASECEIGIMPYKPTCLNNYYSLPNKLSEYMMAGLAVVASDLPEIDRLNKKIGFGELFNPSKPTSIAEAIKNLIVDKEYLKRCKNRAKEWALNEGNWEHESRKIVSLYKELFGE